MNEPTDTRALAMSAKSLNDIVALDDGALFTEEALGRAITLLDAKAFGLVADVETESGRKEIASMSHAVGGAIARFDDRRREYVRELKARPAAIDKLVREVFTRPAEKIQESIRAPLDRWTEDRRAEDEEAGRIIADLSAPIVAGTSAEALVGRMAEVRAIVVPDWLRPDQCRTIDEAKGAAVARIRAAHADAVLNERQAAELARLRAEAAERERADREERIRREAAAKALEDEARRVQVEAAPAQVEVPSVTDAAPGPDVIDQVAKVYGQADRAHRARCNSEALYDLVALGLTDGQARRVVAEIVMGLVRHVSIVY